VKILENELSRKEKTIEDLFSHNQLIAQNAKHQTNSNQSLLPLA
jgi:tetrahydromethanopterin S-methyltransferase subunit F